MSTGSSEFSATRPGPRASAVFLFVLVFSRFLVHPNNSFHPQYFDIRDTRYVEPKPVVRAFVPPIVCLECPSSYKVRASFVPPRISRRFHMNYPTHHLAAHPSFCVLLAKRQYNPLSRQMCKRTTPSKTTCPLLLLLHCID